MGMFVGLLFGAGLVVAFMGTAPQLHRPRPSRHSPLPWPQFIDDVASGVRAGISLPLAIFEAGERLPQGARQVFAHWRNAWSSGIGFEQSLVGLREGLTSTTFDQFAQTIEIAHRQGGRSVATLLTQLARNVRAQEQLVHEVRGRQAVTVTSAKVAVAAPWVVLLLTCARPEVRTTYLSAQGLGVVALVFVVTTLSFVAMRRLAEIEEMRVMR